MPRLYQRPQLRACDACCEHFGIGKFVCPSCNAPAPSSTAAVSQAGRARRIRQALGVTASAALLAHGLSACVTAKYGCGEDCDWGTGDEGDGDESTETADDIVSDENEDDAKVSPSDDSASIQAEPATKTATKLFGEPKSSK